MNQFSRRQFLDTAGGATTSTIVLNLGGNPPELVSEATTEPVETADISLEQIPETTRSESMYFKYIRTPS